MGKSYSLSVASLVFQVLALILAAVSPAARWLDTSFNTSGAASLTQFCLHYYGTLTSSSEYAQLSVSGPCNPVFQRTVPDGDYITEAVSEIASDPTNDLAKGQFNFFTAKRSAGNTVGASIALACVFLICSIASTSHFIQAHKKVGGTTYYPKGDRSCCCCDCGSCRLGDPCTAVGTLVGALLSILLIGVTSFPTFVVSASKLYAGSMAQWAAKNLYVSGSAVTSYVAVQTTAGFMMFIVSLVFIIIALILSALARASQEKNLAGDASLPTSSSSVTTVVVSNAAYPEASASGYPQASASGGYPLPTSFYPVMPSANVAVHQPSHQRDMFGAAKY